ncbi:MAG: sugar-binding protein [Veillonella sp.]|nr:sugar-binding protein [Veillonella sp.]
MNDLLEVYRRIAPELVEVVEERYSILSHISHAQPVGRRMLASLCNLSERSVRSHIELMRDNGLVDLTGQGVMLTADGQQWLPKISKSLYELNRLNELEEALREKLHLERVVIASTGEANAILKQLGFAASSAIQEVLEHKQVIAISGGSTMAAVAEQLPAKHLESTVVPARGGVGERVEFQANVIASVIAERLNGTYKMLHLPDGLSETSLQMLIKMEPQIQEVNELVHKADILMFGIGEALSMAKLRNLPEDTVASLQEAGAVGEALGQYCDARGHILYSVNNVGITLDQLHKVPHVFAVAGGRDKARAIIGVMRAAQTGTLIIDGAAAEGICQILGEEVIEGDGANSS